MASTGYVRVRESFIGSVGQGDIDFRAGELVPEDHPAVIRYPAMFEPIASRFDRPAAVEQATAAPGERRRR